MLEAKIPARCGRTLSNSRLSTSVDVEIEVVGEMVVTMFVDPEDCCCCRPVAGVDCDCC